MATLKAEEFVGEFLEHYGVKGMKWGVSRSRAERRKAKAEADKDVKVEVKPGKGVKTKGGKGRDASQDAVNAAVAKQIAKKSGTDALTNQELQAVVQRMNLEQQYTKLSKGQQGLGEKFVEQFMKDAAPKLVGDLIGVETPGKKKK